jgi:hypothetical protein
MDQTGSLAERGIEGVMASDMSGYFLLMNNAD